MKPPRDCPCGSLARYADCCGPLHAGVREAETPVALMRSRYAAFALGLGEYLVKTLAAAHPDRATPRAALVRALSRAKDTQRYLALRILHTATRGDEGEVLFHAKVFEKGADRSFAELSTFAKEDGGWRYVDGLLVPGAQLPKDLDGLTREAFVALAG